MPSPVPLGISVGELARKPAPRLELAGDWTTNWRADHGGSSSISAGRIVIRALGDDRYGIKGGSGATGMAGLGCRWRGELRLFDNEVLMGWYAWDAGAVRTRGTLFLVPQRGGARLVGHSVGMGRNGSSEIGSGVFVRATRWCAFTPEEHASPPNPWVTAR